MDLVTNALPRIEMLESMSFHRDAIPATLLTELSGHVRGAVRERLPNGAQS